MTINKRRTIPFSSRHLSFKARVSRLKSRKGHMILILDDDQIVCTLTMWFVKKYLTMSIPTTRNRYLFSSFVFVAFHSFYCPNPLPQFSFLTVSIVIFFFERLNENRLFKMVVIFCPLSLKYLDNILAFSFLSKC